MSVARKCGKVRHRTAAHATLALRKVNNKGLNAYHCKRCRGWHLGNYRAFAGDRIRQLLDTANTQERT